MFAPFAQNALNAILAFDSLSLAQNQRIGRYPQRKPPSRPRGTMLVLRIGIPARPEPDSIAKLPFRWPDDRPHPDAAEQRIFSAEGAWANTRP